jgi:hypothetical protein
VSITVKIDPPAHFRLAASVVIGLGLAGCAYFSTGNEARSGAPVIVERNELAGRIYGAHGPDEVASRESSRNPVSVDLLFTGTVGVVVPEGAVVSDGIHECTVNHDVMIRAHGKTPLVGATCRYPGVFTIPAHTLNTIVSRHPAKYTLSVTNPSGSIPISSLPDEIQGRTHVNLVFSGNPGFVVRRGFNVSDDKHLYSVIKDETIQESGQTRRTLAVATQTGSWKVPADTVKYINTSVSALFRITVTNPDEGTPGTP